MKLLVDMNLSPRWVETFSRAGIEAVHWSSLGVANAPDSEIMALRQMATELENGALLIIDPVRTRLRVLPLQLRR